MHRWIQITLTEMIELEKHEEIELVYGYSYVDPITQLKMVEYHVDDHHGFQDKMNATTRFGGNLSVRKPRERKPIIGFGQDEAIMKQYCFTTKAWTVQSGQKAIVPKERRRSKRDDIGLFVSREFGIGLKSSQEELQKINQAVMRRQPKRQGEETQTNIHLPRVSLCCQI